MKIQKNWVGGDEHLKNHQGKKGGEKENTKLAGVMGFFHFNLLTISSKGN